MYPRTGLPTSFRRYSNIIVTKRANRASYRLEEKLWIKAFALYPEMNASDSYFRRRPGGL